MKCSDLKKLPEDLQNIVTTQQFSLAGLAKPEEDDKEDKVRLSPSLSFVTLMLDLLTSCPLGS